MKPNSAFPAEVSKCILLINVLLPTSCQGCRLIRTPSPVLGSSPDTGTGGRSPGLGTYGSRMCQPRQPGVPGMWAAGNEHSSLGTSPLQSASLAACELKGLECKSEALLGSRAGPASVRGGNQDTGLAAPGKSLQTSTECVSSTLTPLLSPGHNQG